MTPQELRASLFADEQEELRVKAIWMAQYWGQSVWQYYAYGDKMFPVRGHQVEYKIGWLQLRTVSQLTDWELKTLAELCGWLKGKSNDLVEMGKDCIKQFEDDFHLSIMAYHYLLHSSILLTFTYSTSAGEVKTLSVEQILALGWAVIKQD